MKYYVYKITNLVNHKIYIGRRKHLNPNVDVYMGSGTQIKRAITKYGIENFSKEILAVFDSEKESAELEASLVTKDFCLREDTYNMHEGGYGGFSHINDNATKRQEVSRIASEHNKKNGIGGTKNWTEDSYNKVRKQGKLNNELKLNSGWHHSDKTKRQLSCIMSKKQAGEKNSQFGRIWISNIETKEVRRITNGDPIPQGWVRGKKGKEKTTCWVNNTVSEYLIKIEEKQEYVDKGFDCGRLTLSMPQSKIVV